jgi:hypothetical protein
MVAANLLLQVCSMWLCHWVTYKGFMQWFLSWLMANDFTTNVCFAVLLQEGLLC